jgi:hypothetical protein
MDQFSTHSYFENNTEEFYHHKTLSTPIKLLSSLSLLIQCHISIFSDSNILYYVLSPARLHLLYTILLTRLCCT